MNFFRIFALLITGALISSCSTASSPAPNFSGEPPKIGKCGGYITFNLSPDPTTDPIMNSEIEEGKAFCAKIPKEPCLENVIKRERGDIIYTCKELE